MSILYKYYFKSLVRNNNEDTNKHKSNLHGFLAYIAWLIIHFYKPFAFFVPVRNKNAHELPSSQIFTFNPNKYL